MSRRIQYSLCDLLITMTVISAVFMLVGFIYRLRHDQPFPVPVTGAITLNGEPAKGWDVTFRYAGFDAEGATALATTDADGKFTLAILSTGEATVWPGKYRVGLIPPPLPRKKYEWRPSFSWITRDLPRDYSDPDRSGLNAVVRQSGKNDFRFDLTYDPERAPCVDGLPPVPFLSEVAVVDGAPGDAPPFTVDDEDDDVGGWCSVMTIDDVQDALHATGWSIDEAPDEPRPHGTLWQVIIHRGERKIMAKATSQADAWREALSVAEPRPALMSNYRAPESETQE